MAGRALKVGTHGGQSKETDAAWRQGPDLDDWGHSACKSRGAGEVIQMATSPSRVDGHEGVAWLLYSPCPCPSLCYPIHHCDTGRAVGGDAPRRSCQPQSRRAEDCIGAITPLGLGGGRPVAVMAMAQPAGAAIKRSASTHARGCEMPGVLSPPELQEGDEGRGDVGRFA